MKTVERKLVGSAERAEIELDALRAVPRIAAALERLANRSDPRPTVPEKHPRLDLPDWATGTLITINDT